MYKIIGADGQPYGPVTAEQLRQWIAEGRVNAQTQAQAEGSTEWKPLSAFPEFAGNLAGVPPRLASTPAQPAKTSGMAIWSLVLGILGLFSCGLSAIPGLILGIVGLTKINRSGGRLGGNGLAIAGICVSGVMLLMMPIYAGMLLPALNSAREKARRVQCQSNLKQLGLAMAIYANENGDHLPNAARWSDAARKFIASETVFYCPSDRTKTPAYAFNVHMSKGVFQGDPDVVLLFESEGGWNATGDSSTIFARHKQGCNVLFNDGHVEFIRKENFDKLRWEPRPAEN
jgi:prepilin-type processing-associated H-X9-DG protein